MPLPVPSSEEYFRQQQLSDQNVNQRAAYASAIAEALGQYTPQLEQEALLPLAQRPTVAENLLSAPIRGIGKLFGSEKLQQYGAPQAFDLGYAPPQGTPMPQIPEGLPAELKETLQGMASSLGYGQPQGKKDTLPNVPSETSGRARLKTRTEREAEQRMQDRMWDFVIKHYESEQARQLQQAQLEQVEQSIQESMAREKEIEARVKRGLPPSQWTLTKEYMDQTGEDFVTVQTKLNAAKTNRTAQLQIYDQVKNEGFEGDFEDWLKIMNRAKWNPINAAATMFYNNPLAAFQIPMEQHPEAIGKMAVTLGLAAEAYNQDMIARGKEGLGGGAVPIPQELLAQGVNEVDIKQMMEMEGITRSQAIQKLLEYMKNRGKPQQPPIKAE